MTTFSKTQRQNLGRMTMVLVLVLGLVLTTPLAKVHADVVYGAAPILCSLTTNTSSIENGQAGYLSWTSYGATSAFLSDGIGNVSPNGVETVRPASSRTYVLTVYGASGQATQCATAVTVTQSSYAYTGQSGTQNTYESYNTNAQHSVVSLSQIPYTGIDWGTTGDAVAWLSVVGFAASAAYLLYYFRLARV